MHEPGRAPPRAGLVQHRWHANVATLQAELAEGIRLAAEAGAQIVFLPELTLSKYPGNVRASGIPQADAEQLRDGPTFAFAATQALRHNVIVHASLFSLFPFLMTRRPDSYAGLVAPVDAAHPFGSSGTGVDA